ncbi:MAG: tetratricopeptide repeat protein [Nitrospiraceae bacterium]|jgi:tetratricopeptide (TPR) repeat protein|nr:MAG: tetratricopeptide repeat protein [Nitrospiraceae bacterium]
MHEFKVKKDSQEKIQRAGELLGQGDYDGYLNINEEVLALLPDRPPGDEALFNIGLIYIHNDNPKKNYKKSLQMFKRLVHDFPQSNLVEEARIWIGLLEVIEKSKQADIEIEEKKKELTQ